MTGIAWYHESDYDSLRNRFEDKNILPETYAEWLLKANELLTNLKINRIEAVKVYLTPDEFLPWCEEKKYKLDSKARAEYANEGVMRGI